MKPVKARRTPGAEPEPARLVCRSGRWAWVIFRGERDKVRVRAVDVKEET